MRATSPHVALTSNCMAGGSVKKYAPSAPRLPWQVATSGNNKSRQIQQDTTPILRMLQSRAMVLRPRSFAASGTAYKGMSFRVCVAQQLCGPAAVRPRRFRCVGPAASRLPGLHTRVWGGAGEVRRSRRGRPDILGEVNQTPNQPQPRVSWTRLFMCVDVLGIFGEVNQT